MRIIWSNVMESEIRGYLTEFGILRKQLDEALKGISDDAVDWQPLPRGTNSIYAIITHLTGAQNYWVWVSMFSSPGNYGNSAVHR